MTRSIISHTACASPFHTVPNLTLQIFSANTDYYGLVMITFPKLISGRYLRIILVQCENYCGLNFRVLGCRLVDECAQHQDMCDTNANCSDEEDGYRCTCKSGFVRNGFNCESKKRVQTPNQTFFAVGYIVYFKGRVRP